MSPISRYSHFIDVTVHCYVYSKSLHLLHFHLGFLLNIYIIYKSIYIVLREKSFDFKFMILMYIRGILIYFSFRLFTIGVQSLTINGLHPSRFPFPTFDVTIYIR